MLEIYVTMATYHQTILNTPETKFSDQIFL